MNAVVPALLLTAYAGFASLVLPRWLAAARWPARAPRLGIAAWQAATASVLGAIAMALLAVVAPVHPLNGSLLRFLRSCFEPAQAGAAPGGAATRLVAAAALVALLTRVTVVAFGTWWRRAGELGRQTQALQLLAGPDAGNGVRVLASDMPAAFCVPGAGGVVLTTAAVGRLGDEELGAVLAHERAHLVQRHHLLVFVARTFAAALPRLPVAREGARQVERLVELAADDHAVRRRDRWALAEALLAMSSRPSPPGALAVAAGGVSERVLRLAEGPVPLGAVHTAAASTMLAAGAAVPIASLVAPALLLSATCSMT